MLETPQRPTASAPSVRESAHSPTPRFDTLAVHAGEASPVDGAMPSAPAIVQASSFWYESADQLDRVLGGAETGFVYGRYANPTVVAFEQACAALEGAPRAVAFGSGMAALQAVITATASTTGDTLFASPDCYGGTYTLLTRVVAKQGTRVQFVDVADLEGLASACACERPRALLVEVVSNPLQRVADLQGIGEVTASHGVKLIVDSTFTSPYLVRPLNHGADYVVHSATKYLGGHGDVTGGVVACASPDEAAALDLLRRFTGAVLAPMEAYLALRGLRTLSLRLERQCRNALELATWLETHPSIERVYYPGLASSPDRALADRLLRSGCYGGVLAFGIRGADRQRTVQVMQRLRLIRPAPTLGDCHSLILYPSMSSHRGLTPEQRAERGIHENILRLSTGIEDVADLVADLEQALSAV